MIAHAIQVSVRTVTSSIPLQVGLQKSCFAYEMANCDMLLCSKQSEFGAQTLNQGLCSFSQGWSGMVEIRGKARSHPVVRAVFTYCMTSAIFTVKIANLVMLLTMYSAEFGS